jgi:hypothetical protein
MDTTAQLHGQALSMALRSVVAQLFATLEKKEILTKADISSILANAKRDAESLSSA